LAEFNGLVGEWGKGSHDGVGGARWFLTSRQKVYS
jgi:hypothetical protein